MVCLLKIGFDFGNLACGLDSPNPLPEKIAYDYEFTDLKRAYGRPDDDPVPPVILHSPEFPFPHQTGGGVRALFTETSRGVASIPLRDSNGWDCFR